MSPNITFSIIPSVNIQKESSFQDHYEDLLGIRELFLNDIDFYENLFSNDCNDLIYNMIELLIKSVYDI